MGNQTSLNDYARMIDHALEKKEPLSAYNKDMGHASVVVCLAFKHAKAHVRLLSEHLDPVLYALPWCVEEAKGFLNKGGKLDVLVEKDVAEGHPFREMDVENDAMTLRRVPKDRQKYPCNFMVVDDFGFRFEREREKHQALVAFHEKEDRDQIIPRLVAHFESLSEVAIAL